MKIIDTHTHIYSDRFNTDRPDIINNAKKNGIKAILLPNEDSTTIEPIKQICREAEGFAYPMIGIHPTCIKGNYINEMKQVEAAINKEKYYAIGEIGLDLYWDKSYLKEQKAAFKEQLSWSIDLQLPVSIHTRNSFYETLECIYNVGEDKLSGVFHCFNSSVKEWEEISKLPSFYVGIGGVVTFKNNSLEATLPKVPIERVVLETDAPYLAPVPYRGKRNEPAFITEIAKKVAACYNETPEEIAKQVYTNSLSLFNLPKNTIKDEKF